MVESVTKVFETEGGGVRALDSVSLEIPDHRFTAVMGPSGWQRVALATRASAIFADEPSGSLDSRTGRDVLGILRSAVDEHGQAIVMVTHDPIAASYAENVIFMPTPVSPPDTAR